MLEPGTVREGGQTARAVKYKDSVRSALSHVRDSINICSRERVIAWR